VEIKSVEESITAAMEDFNINLIKYYPYILQDFWEMGTPSEEIIKLIIKHKQNYKNLNVLDVGSGKGAVLIKIASELKCKCLGIDAMNDFVIFSNNKAKEYSVDDICTFETNDIRTRINTLGKYDIIILGAIGPVLGDYYNMLTQLAPHLNKDGLIVIDDAYIKDGQSTDYPGVMQKSDIIKQTKNAGMEIIDEITINEIPGTDEGYLREFENLQKRCLELVEKYPESKNMFLDYVKTQKKLYEKLSNEVTPVIFVIKEKPNA